MSHSNSTNYTLSVANRILDYDMSGKHQYSILRHTTASRLYRNYT